MNKSVLKWVLVAAVIVAAIAYLVISEMPRDSKEKPSKTQSARSEYVSDAYRSEPLEGFTISAPEGALGETRDIKVSPVGNKTYKRVTKLVAEEGVKPLYVFEVDAGLKSDEYFPGDYNVTMDLDKMGIPRILQDRIRVYRVAGSGEDEACLKLKSRVSNGKVSFSSNQNSFWTIALGPVGGRLVHGALRAVFEFGACPGKSLRRFFFNEPTRIQIPFQDESGDFALKFRWRDTENPDGFDAFMENERQAMEIIDQLEKDAQSIYKDRLKSKYESANVSTWDQWFPSDQVKSIRESISVEAIRDSLIQNNKELARLNSMPESQLPQSILKIRDMIIRSNRYLNSLGLHPLNFELPVYLVNNEVMGQDVEGAAKPYNTCGDAFMMVNYNQSRMQKPLPNTFDKLQCTLVHELCHVRQQCYYSFILMNGDAAEGSVVVMERDAARLWFRNGIIKIDPDKNTAFNGLNKILTERDHKFLYSFPFDKATSYAGLTKDKAADWGYTIGDAIEGIRKGVGKESVTIKPFLDNYSFSGPHVSGWTGWIQKSLGINEAQFNEGWKYFGEHYLSRIYASQDPIMNSKVPKEAATTALELKPGASIVQLKSLSTPRDYSINTFSFDTPKERVRDLSTPASYMRVGRRFNIFLFSKGKDGVQGPGNPYLNFYITKDLFKEYVVPGEQPGEEVYLRASPTVYCEGNSNSYQLAAIATTQSKGEKQDYYVAALFVPDQLLIRKVKTDKISFIMPKPSRDLVSQKLITGAVVTYKDKNGNVQTHDVAPKYFGKKVKWLVPGCTAEGNSFSLSLHWYYKPDDATTYVSPESDPATWGIKDAPKADGPAPGFKPKDNYWKQVGARMLKSNTSIDEEEGNGGKVSSDYRSISFDKEADNCFEFSAMAATEEVGEEGRVYVSDIYMEGTVTFTEPPKEWVPSQQYVARWQIAEDPFVRKISVPFVFTAENTSSSQDACTQSRSNKIDKGHSTIGKADWLRSFSTVFEARYPEKDTPKSFSITQTYSILEKEGSDLKATVTFIYDYEWVGEPEKEEEKEPEGGHWKLVKKYEDDTHNTYEDHQHETKIALDVNVSISGGSSRFTLNAHRSVKGSSKGRADMDGTVTQTANITAPKSNYYPGEAIGFDYTIGDRSQTGDPLDYKLGISRFYITTPYVKGEKTRGADATVGASADYPAQQYDIDRLVAPSYDPEWARTFTIVDQGRAGVGQKEVVHLTVYEYQWVDGRKKNK